MVVKDEARILPCCLDSVRDIAGEFIVIDTGSADQTPDIARSYGARVIPFDFTKVDFAAARNRAIEHAGKPWILMLDADEALDSDTAGTLKGLLSQSENVGYFLERRNQAGNAQDFFTDHVVRLFPNRPHHRYRGRVHETIDASIVSGGGLLIKSEVRIDHQFRPDPESRRRKNLWYIEILKEEIGENPDDDSRLDFLAAEYHQLEMFDEATLVAEQIARSRPGDPRAHLFAGVYHLLYRPDLEQARADFQRVLSLRPDYEEAKGFLRLLEEREQSSWPDTGPGTKQTRVSPAVTAPGTRRETLSP